MSGTWVRRYTPRFKPGPLHRCEPPMQVGRWGERPDGEHGYLWRCECGKLWTVDEYPFGPGTRMEPRWKRAGLLTRIQKRKAGR